MELPLYVTGTLASVWLEALAQQLAQNMGQHVLGWWQRARRLARASLSIALEQAWLNPVSHRQRRPLEQAACAALLKGDASAIFALPDSMFAAAAQQQQQDGAQQQQPREQQIRHQRAQLAAALHSQTIRSCQSKLQMRATSGTTWQDQLMPLNGTGILSLASSCLVLEDTMMKELNSFLGLAHSAVLQHGISQDDAVQAASAAAQQATAHAQHCAQLCTYAASAMTGMSEYAALERDLQHAATLLQQAREYSCGLLARLHGATSAQLPDAVTVDQLSWAALHAVWDAWTVLCSASTSVVALQAQAEAAATATASRQQPQPPPSQTAATVRQQQPHQPHTSPHDATAGTAATPIDEGRQQPGGNRSAATSPVVNGPAVQGHGTHRHDPADTGACTLVCALLRQQASGLHAIQPALQCSAARRKMAAATEWLRAIKAPQNQEDLLGDCTPASLLLALARLCSGVLGQRLLRQHSVLAMADLLTKQHTLRAKKERLQLRVDGSRQQQCDQHQQQQQQPQRRPIWPVEGMQQRHEQSRQQARTAAAKRRRSALLDASNQLHHITNAMHKHRQAVRHKVSVYKQQGGLWQGIAERLQVLQEALVFCDAMEEHLLVGDLCWQSMLYCRHKRSVVMHTPEAVLLWQQEEQLVYALGQACVHAQSAMIHALGRLSGVWDPLLVVVDTPVNGLAYHSVDQLWAACTAAGPSDAWLPTCSRQAQGVWEVVSANMFGVGMIACMFVDENAAYRVADSCTACAALAPVQKHVDTCRKQMRGCCKHLRKLSHSLTPLPGFTRPHLHMSDTFIKFLAQGLSKTDTAALLQWRQGRAPHQHNTPSLATSGSDVAHDSDTASMIAMAKAMVGNRAQIDKAPQGTFRCIFFDDDALCKLSKRSLTGHVSTDGVALHVHFEHKHQTHVDTCGRQPKSLSGQRQARRQRQYRVEQVALDAARQDVCGSLHVLGCEGTSHAYAYKGSEDDAWRACGHGPVTDKQLRLLDLDMRLERTISNGTVVCHVVPATPCWPRLPKQPQQGRPPITTVSDVESVHSTISSDRETVDSVDSETDGASSVDAGPIGSTSCVCPLQQQ